MAADYELIDSGDGRKLERFGDITLARPAAQAVWRRRRPDAVWQSATASFDRSDGNRWYRRDALPTAWTISVSGIRFRLSATDFGHLGVFPEQQDLWTWLHEVIETRRRRTPDPVRVLNLFAYSGGATLAAARAGAEVCHLDASKGMVDWARENAALNQLADAPIRWIVDDVMRFVQREDRRKRVYDAVILDPPSFGRGKRGEVFKIQEQLADLLDLCTALLSDKPLFLLLSCHTPDYSPVTLGNLVQQWMADRPGEVGLGEMQLRGGPEVLALPSGAYAHWRAADGVSA